MNHMGLAQAARQIEGYGRGPDKQLAHLSPDEAEFLDYVQGGRRENPMTGLPEYSLFGKILKSVAKVAAGIGGFAVAGPAGAALASGAATKLTGGSWKDALKTGAMSGLGSYAAQGLSGAGWSPIGKNSVAAGLGGQPAAARDLASQIVPTGQLAGSTEGFNAASGGISGAIAGIGGYPGVVAGLGALSVPTDPKTGQPILPDQTPPPGFGGNINLNVEPVRRIYQTYMGDPNKFGEMGGGHMFFDQVNPKPKFLAEGGRARGYALGGGVMSPRGPGAGLGGLAALNNPGIPSQIQTPAFSDPMQARAMARDLSPRAQRDELRRAAIMGYVNAKDGGAISGPGTGTSDSIPAMLSDGEHVIDQKTVDLMGDGNNDKGHRAIERMKQSVRRNAGVANPKKPPAFQGKAEKHG